MREAGTVADLKDITRPVQHHLEKFEGVFREAMRSKVPLVDLVIRYIVRQKGKRVRPLLVMLTADVCGGVNDRTFRGATLVEILHTGGIKTVWAGSHIRGPIAVFGNNAKIQTISERGRVQAFNAPIMRKMIQAKRATNRHH